MWSHAARNPLPQFKTENVCKTVTNKNTKFSNTVMKITVGVVPLRTVLIILMHYIFELLPINGHDMNRTAEINFHLT
jgi:hypothetical protein